MKVEVRCELCEGVAPDRATNDFYGNGDLKQGSQWIGPRMAMVSWNFIDIKKICAYIHFSGENKKIFQHIFDVVHD